eukprot:scaffold64_cov338-Pavlova_lutheri.AAC.45
MDSFSICLCRASVSWQTLSVDRPCPSPLASRGAAPWIFSRKTWPVRLLFASFGRSTPSWLGCARPSVSWQHPRPLPRFQRRRLASPSVAPQPPRPTWRAFPAPSRSFRALRPSASSISSRLWCGRRPTAMPTTASFRSASVPRVRSGRRRPPPTHPRKPPSSCTGVPSARKGRDGRGKARKRDAMPRANVRNDRSCRSESTPSKVRKEVERKVDPGLKGKPSG